MRTPRLFYLAVLTLGVALTSCSQGGDKKTSETATDEKSTSISGVAIDTTKSKVSWAGTMLGIYTHTGTIQLSKAEISMKDGIITGGSFVIDMNTISTTDDNYDVEKGSTPEKLIGHLMSADFFDVGNHPVAKFEITSVDGSTATGMLTVRGITSEGKVENISISKQGDQVIIKGDMTFDRKKYDVAWDSPMKERVLSNDVQLQIELIGS